MPSDAPPIAYEANAPSRDASFWFVLRLGLIAWSATVLTRHAAYWIGLREGGTTRAMIFVAIEVVLLVSLLITAITARGRTPARSALLLLGGLGAAWVAIVMINFALNSIAAEVTSPMRLVWQFATQLQICIVPLMAAAAAVSLRHVRTA